MHERSAPVWPEVELLRDYHRVINLGEAGANFAEELRRVHWAMTYFRQANPIIHKLLLGIGAGHRSSRQLASDAGIPERTLRDWGGPYYALRELRHFTQATTEAAKTWPALEKGQTFPRGPVEVPKEPEHTLEDVEELSDDDLRSLELEDESHSSRLFVYQGGSEKSDADAATGYDGYRAGKQEQELEAEQEAEIDQRSTSSREPSRRTFEDPDDDFDDEYGYTSD